MGKYVFETSRKGDDELNRLAAILRCSKGETLSRAVALLQYGVDAELKGDKLLVRKDGRLVEIDVIS